jgi:hypothetical protein
LQARGRGSGFFAGDLGAELTPEEQAAVDQYRAREGEIRTELRGLVRDLRGDIDRLQALVIFINVWLAPLLIAVRGAVLVLAPSTARECGAMTAGLAERRRARSLTLFLIAGALVAVAAVTWRLKRGVRAHRAVQGPVCCRTSKTRSAAQRITVTSAEATYRIERTEQRLGDARP